MILRVVDLPRGPSACKRGSTRKIDNTNLLIARFGSFSIFEMEKKIDLLPFSARCMVIDDRQASRARLVHALIPMPGLSEGG